MLRVIAYLEKATYASTDSPSDSVSAPWKWSSANVSKRSSSAILENNMAKSSAVTAASMRQMCSTDLSSGHVRLHRSSAVLKSRGSDWKRRTYDGTTVSLMRTGAGSSVLPSWPS